MNNIYKRFLDNYDDCFEDGITKKEFAKRLRLSPQALNSYLEQSGKRAPLQPIEYLSLLVKEHITSNGGSIRSALEKLGYDDAGIKTFSVRKHLQKQGFDWRYYAYIGLELGTYRAGVIVDGAYDLPFARRRINVVCLNCGHEHTILVSNFSSGASHRCAYCPKQSRVHRAHRIIETGEVGSLRKLWRNNFNGCLPYVSLRQKVMRKGFFKDEASGLTIVLLDTDDAVAQISLVKGNQKRKVLSQEYYTPNQSSASIK